jgi:hypothetical protein
MLALPLIADFFAICNSRHAITDASLSTANIRRLNHDHCVGEQIASMLTLSNASTFVVSSRISLNPDAVFLCCGRVLYDTTHTTEKGLPLQ